MRRISPSILRPAVSMTRYRIAVTASPLVAVGLIVAVLVSSCGSSPKPANGKVSVQSTETLKSDDVTTGGVAGTGHFTISGAIADADW